MKKFSPLFMSLFLLVTLTTSCQQTPVNPRLSDEWKPMASKKRFRLVKKNTQNFQQYKGVDLLFDINVTFLSSDILDDNLKKKSQFMMWDLDKAKDEDSKNKLTKINKSYFFITVYSLKKKLNQLNLKASDWTATLILNDGTIHTGKIKLHQNLNNHNSVFYPHVESWDKTYMASFDVPTNKLSKEKFIFDITSPRGTARFNY